MYTELYNANQSPAQNFHMHKHSLPRLKALALLNTRFKPSLTSLQTKQIHAQLLTNNALTSPSLVSKLIQHYSLTHSPHKSHYAYLLYQHFKPKSLFLFNTLLRCTTPRRSIVLFAKENGLSFDDFTYIFVLGACARSCSLSASWEGRQVHARVIKIGFIVDLSVCTTLVHFYGSNREIGSARKVFDEMHVRSSVTWNAMITAYCSSRKTKNSCAHDGLVLFQDMLVDVSGVKPSGTTMVCVVSASSQVGVLETGACIHAYTEKTIDRPTNDLFIGTGLIDMYAKCGCLESALAVFNEMKSRNVLTWTAMATGLALHGKGQEALKLLDEMKSRGVMPNAVTFTSLLSACCHAGLTKEGLLLFHSIREKFGVMPQIQHYGCFVDLLGRAGHLKEAYDLMESMPVEPDPILWRSLMSASKFHGDVIMAEKIGKLLIELQLKYGSADLSVSGGDYVALSNIYASAEKWDEVEMLREEMKAKGIEAKYGTSAVQATGNFHFAVS